MNGSVIILSTFLALGLIWTPVPGWSQKVQPVKVAIFESQVCSECEPINTALNQLQLEVGAEKLNIVHHVLENPDSREAFIQHQVTTLPEYVVMSPQGDMILLMKNTIEPDRLLWEVKELLGKNESLVIPDEIEQTLMPFRPSHAALLLLFYPGTDKDGEHLVSVFSQQAGLFLLEKPHLFTFDSRHPQVQNWMKTLSLPETGPAYVLAMPGGSIYKKSLNPAQPWHLAKDLRACAQKFNSELQTILVNLTTPGPSDDDILPATMGPKSQPVSDEMFLPLQF